MIIRVWRAYRAEVIKALRWRQTWIGPLLLLASVVLTVFVHPILRDNRSDYDFIALATPATVNLLGFVLLLIWTASLIAPEIGDGSFRLFLVRPVYRHEYVLAKFLAAVSYALLLLTVTGFFAWTFVFSFGEMNGVDVGGELLFTHESMVWAFLQGSLLCLLPMAAGAAIALLVSACSRSGAQAISVVLGFWLMLDMVKHPLHIDAWVFTTYLEAPWQIFINRCDGLDASWQPMISQCFMATMPVIFLGLLAAMLVIRRRDLSL